MPPAGSGAWETDLHVHTTMSDGDLPLIEVVAVAAERGVRVGIADHVSRRNPPHTVYTREGIDRYLVALERAPVLRGGEFCWCDDLWLELPGEVMGRFDYRIGSNHGFWLPDGSQGSPWWRRLPAEWQSRPHQLMEIMVGNLCDLVRGMPVHILAHATLLPPALLDLEPDVHAWWTEEREEALVQALCRSGVALEISSRYRLPHDRLLARARDAGARFSLGSDGHRREEIGRLDWALAAARRLELPEERLFLPERAREEARR